jgi:RHS repeat-associated protein
MGTCATNATLTINNERIDHADGTFRKEFSVNNSSAAVYSPIDVVGVKNNVGPNGEDAVSEESGSVFVPKTPESFSYDADGNLLTNGRWAHGWDGENRLTTVTALASIPDAAKGKVVYVSDYMGRMIQRTAYAWSGGAYSVSSTHKFVYDGWRIVAELNGNGTPIRTYMWGTDLSGSMEGAGGVGGLLSMRDEATGKVYNYCYDGNGNIVALVDADTGAVVAQYEYGPFGELIRAAGPMAKANPFRFSTKYQDPLTGYLYYGFRWYDPSTGRWLGRDPMQERYDANLYASSPKSVGDFWLR